MKRELFKSLDYCSGNLVNFNLMRSYESLFKISGLLDKKVVSYTGKYVCVLGKGNTRIQTLIFSNKDDKSFSITFSRISPLNNTNAEYHTYMEYGIPKFFIKGSSEDNLKNYNKVSIDDAIKILQGYKELLISVKKESK